MQLCAVLCCVLWHAVLLYAAVCAVACCAEPRAHHGVGNAVAQARLDEATSQPVCNGNQPSAACTAQHGMSQQSVSTATNRKD
jgi:hypothetical protein